MLFSRLEFRSQTRRQTGGSKPCLAANVVRDRADLGRRHSLNGSRVRLVLRPIAPRREVRAHD
jgi:hypothetical protein